MSNPEKAFDLEAIEAHFRAIRAWQESPEGRANAETFRRQQARIAARELAERAEARGVVLDPGVRKVALDPHAIGPLVDAVREALAHHRAKRILRPAILYLGSGAGAGKTSALSWAVVHAERSARYVKATTLENTKRSGWGETEEQWKRWESADLLALDEIGIETDPELISKLLLERWDHASVTLVAGNLSPKAFFERYCKGACGVRLIDRLAEQKALGLRAVRAFSDPSRRAK